MISDGLVDAISIDAESSGSEDAVAVAVVVVVVVEEEVGEGTRAGIEIRCER